jgi:V/A-type H+-transporting ATPase subunit E
MNGINKITDAIAAETRAEIDAIRAEAQSKCREIESFYEAQAQREYDDLMREGKQDGELQLKRLTGAAAMEAKKTILSMKQEAVDAVLKASIERICDLSDEQYTAFLAKLAAQAAFTGTEEVIFNRRDCKSGVARNVVAKANDLLKKRKLLPKLTVSSENGSFAGGIIVKQGDIEVNCTVEKLVETNRDRLASDIAAVLFAE